MKVSREELHQLIARKLTTAGLTPEHAAVVADVLSYADARGIHSHGAVRVEYYAERIARGGTNTSPALQWEETGPCSGILHADNGPGHVAANLAMEHAIDMAKTKGVAVVGIRQMGHCGALSYFVHRAAKAGLIAVSVCQSDPMVVPFGSADIYYGTNPIAFAAPGEGEQIITFDMATTVQAWGKILDARARNEKIPDTWAVDGAGDPTTDPYAVEALLPMSGPKGYGLMMMVDVLSGILLGLPFGRSVSSMYEDLTAGRDLGQLHIVINPAFFTSSQIFRKNISQMLAELVALRPAPGFEKVLYPGQNLDIYEEHTKANGIELIDDIYRYLISEELYTHTYQTQSPFAH
ncbi:ureidoglycolate dehydrogenase [Rahnella aceris]|uniref:ureidoglycolate dehydrogenase n=1 Tax=Rahnella sp. (strain Y9602) TaxID=2703885 RepID=UPI0019040F06|nr:ureidoglycolate dehydrogenase [Rahnella aceris]QQN34323.1 ureidoglycolate dehydrogenase [Rahnella aceris]